MNPHEFYPQIKPGTILGYSRFNFSNLITQHNVSNWRRSTYSEHPLSFFDRVVEVVCREFGLRLECLQSKAKPQSIAWPRQIVMALAYEQGDLSLEEIGARLGGRDHGTVHRGIQTFTDRMFTDAPMRQRVERIKAALRG